MTGSSSELSEFIDGAFGSMERAMEGHEPSIRPQEVGTVSFVGRSVARVTGLPGVRSEELLKFPGDTYGLAFNLDAHEVGVILLDDNENLKAGDEVQRTGRVLDVPVGEGLLGRVVDPLGRPLDDAGTVRAADRWPAEREAPPIMHRAPVVVPLQTGLKVVDALIPVGRGQRELILGDRQTGKTAVAIDTILNQRDTGVICIYCAVGQRNTGIAQVVAELKAHQALDRCVVVVAEGDSAPGLQFVAPFAATTIGEYFMEQGRDVLVIYDDLTTHARAYRELSLLLRRPPGREAFPGDIFYLHSRLLERSTHLSESHGGGSLTALPIAETEAQNVSAYIPTNLISITDGQIYLSPDLFQKGLLPAVDVGRSVSRVGGKTQLPAYRVVAADLRLSYAQFEELEAFSRFSSRLDEQTRATLERGRRVREIFKQPQAQPLSVAEQIVTLIAVTSGIFDRVPLNRLAEAESRVTTAALVREQDICRRIEAGEKITEDDVCHLAQLAENVVREHFSAEQQGQSEGNDTAEQAEARPTESQEGSA